MSSIKPTNTNLTVAEVRGRVAVPHFAITDVKQETKIPPDTVERRGGRQKSDFPQAGGSREEVRLEYGNSDLAQFHIAEIHTYVPLGAFLQQVLS